MKKIGTAILLFDLIAGLLFLGVREMRSYKTLTVWNDMIAQGGQEDVRKIAITFDDEVIIGLSQEISYKEAISMI